MLLGIAIAVALCCAIAFIWPLRTRFGYLLAIALVAVAFCRQLIPVWVTPSGSAVNGIAATTPPLTSLDVVIMGAVLLIPSVRHAAPHVFWTLPGMLSLIIGGALVWPRAGNVLAGVVHLFTSLLAWVVGHAMGEANAKSARTLRLSALAVLTFVALQATVSLAQIAGDDSLDRATGTFNHPSVIGKIVLILLAILLPMSRSTDRATSRAATLGIVLGVVATAASLSRTNLVAIIGALGLWAVLSSGSTRRRRELATALLGVALTLPFLDAIMARFLADPEENQRGGLLEAGLRVTSENLWAGTGPNNFVEVAAQTEAFIARWGAPVHNSLLLLVAELGVLAALAFLLPIGRSVADALLQRKAQSVERRSTSQALLIMLLMVAFACWTGWGFLVAPVLPLLYLVCGYSTGTLAEQDADDASAGRWLDDTGSCARAPDPTNLQGPRT